jgi:hypothetical protein
MNCWLLTYSILYIIFSIYVQEETNRVVNRDNIWEHPKVDSQGQGRKLQGKWWMSVVSDVSAR